MSILIAIALKSLLIGGLTLGLLHLMRRRSAAERSWVAHVGLLALMIMAFAPLVLPNWNVEAPSLLGRAEAPAVAAISTAPPVSIPVASTELQAPVPEQTPSFRQAAPPSPLIDPIEAATAIYAVPAAILLFITLLALARLVALQARAEVLVDSHWLSALARAQRRMGFKHGTALLTSNELASPISWGLVRPVILLNSRAVEAADEAEAIIAHELAHVARFDWIKLLMARLATALFWFNPLIWLLAREAHQLREETADDTVLAADIADTDYAQLLVGVARHECPGLLLGAHGVASSKGSLTRRVARVLDSKSPRGPAARGFTLGVLAGALVVAAPLAALTLTPAAAGSSGSSLGKPSAIEFRLSNSPAVTEVKADLPHIIAQGVSTSVSRAISAVAPATRAATTVALASAANAATNGNDEPLVTRNADGSTVMIYPGDAQGRKKIVARGPNGETVIRYIDRVDGRGGVAEARAAANPAIAIAIETKGIGVTPEFIASIRAAAPQLAGASLSQINGMRALGVTPEFTRSISSAGFPTMSARDLMDARAVGLSATYVNEMRAAGVEGNLDDFIQLRAVGVSPGFAARARASGIQHLDADTLVEMAALGTTRVMLSPKVHMKMRMRSREAAPPDSNEVNQDSNSQPDSNPDG